MIKKIDLKKWSFGTPSIYLSRCLVMTWWPKGDMFNGRHTKKIVSMYGVPSISPHDVRDLDNVNWQLCRLALHRQVALLAKGWKSTMLTQMMLLIPDVLRSQGDATRRSIWSVSRIVVVIFNWHHLVNSFWDHLLDVTYFRSFKSQAEMPECLSFGKKRMVRSIKIGNS